MFLPAARRSSTSLWWPW